MRNTLLIQRSLKIKMGINYLYVVGKISKNLTFSYFLKSTWFWRDLGQLECWCEIHKLSAILICTYWYQFYSESYYFLRFSRCFPGRNFPNLKHLLFCVAKHPPPRKNFSLFPTGFSFSMTEAQLSQKVFPTGFCKIFPAGRTVSIFQIDKR